MSELYIFLNKYICMDNQRIIQVLQDLLNTQNNVVNNVNQYLSEAYSTSYNNVNQYDYQNLQNDNSNLNNRVNELTNTITSLQNDYQNLLNQYNNNNSNYNNSYELDGLRSLVNSLTQDKDYLQNQLNGKDQQITDVQNNLTSQLSYANNTISDLQNQVTDLNSKLTDAINLANAKQASVDAAEQKSAILHDAIENVKAKVEEELKEALRDIDSTIDTLNS